MCSIPFFKLNTMARKKSVPEATETLQTDNASSGIPEQDLQLQRGGKEPVETSGIENETEQSQVSEKEESVEEDVEDSEKTPEEGDDDGEEEDTETGTPPAEVLPSYTARLLSIWPEYQELYIDDKGGVFTKDTQPNIIKEAILYQNPYYKQ